MEPLRRGTVGLSGWCLVGRTRARCWRSGVGTTPATTGPKAATRFRQQLPEARIELVDDANHMILSDQPETVEKLLTEFLQCRRVCAVVVPQRVQAIFFAHNGTRIS
jgi:hypothetical protein